MKEEGLNLIIGLVRKKERGHPLAARNPRKKIVPGVAGGGLDGNSVPGSTRGDIDAIQHAPQVQRGRKSRHEARVVPRRAAPQAVIKVADDELAISALDEQMKQRDGITPAGDADEVPPAHGTGAQMLLNAC